MSDFGHTITFGSQHVLSTLTDVPLHPRNARPPHHHSGQHEGLQGRQYSQPPADPTADSCFQSIRTVEGLNRLGAVRGVGSTVTVHRASITARR